MLRSPRYLSRTIHHLQSFTPSTTSRYFHLTTPKMVKVGDSLPSIDLFETTPATKVDLSKELTGKGVILGVP